MYNFYNLISARLIKGFHHKMLILCSSKAVRNERQGKRRIKLILNIQKYPKKLFGLVPLIILERKTFVGIKIKKKSILQFIALRPIAAASHFLIYEKTKNWEYKKTQCRNIVGYINKNFCQFTG